MTRSVVQVHISPPLHLSMIHLQKFSSNDSQDKLDFLKTANLEVRGFKIVGLFDDVKTVEQMRAKTKELQECQFYWILKDNTPIGVITFRPKPNDFWLHNAGHIGIAIDEPYRGQHYGSEAFQQMCEKANAEYGVKDIIVMALVDNDASRAMIEKSGGEYQGTVIAADGEKLAKYLIKSN